MITARTRDNRGTVRGEQCLADPGRAGAQPVPRAGHPRRPRVHHRHPGHRPPVFDRHPRPARLPSPTPPPAPTGPLALARRLRPRPRRDQGATRTRLNARPNPDNRSQENPQNRRARLSPRRDPIPAPRSAPTPSLGPKTHRPIPRRCIQVKPWRRPVGVYPSPTSGPGGQAVRLAPIFTQRVRP